MKLKKPISSMSDMMQKPNFMVWSILFRPCFVPEQPLRVQGQARDDVKPAARGARTIIA